MRVAAAGAWDQLQGAPPHPPWLDLRDLQRLDHVGAQLLWNHWRRARPAQLACTDSQRTMLTRVAQFTCGTARPAPGACSNRSTTWACWCCMAWTMPATCWRWWASCCWTLACAQPAPPWRDACPGHLYRMGATALPHHGALVGFLIGVVLAWMSLQLRAVRGRVFIVNILGISLIRELGPMLAAILVAGRSGSAITAQIGVMRVTEELDAMRVMGIPHGFRLVLPRALALALAMPLISAGPRWRGRRHAGGDISWASRRPCFCRCCGGGEGRQPPAWPSRWCSACSSPSSAATPARQAQHPEPGRGHDGLGGQRHHHGHHRRRGVRRPSGVGF